MSTLAEIRAQAPELLAADTGMVELSPRELPPLAEVASLSESVQRAGPHLTIRVIAGDRVSGLSLTAIVVALEERSALNPVIALFPGEYQPRLRSLLRRLAQNDRADAANLRLAATRAESRAAFLDANFPD